MTKTQLHCDYSMTTEVTKVVKTKILQTSLRYEGAIQFYIYAEDLTEEENLLAQATY